MNEQEQIFETRAALEIHAPRQVIWDVIKPAANAPILDPRVSRGFKAEGTPDGVGEIQFYIIDIDGKEYVSAMEITEEVEGEFTIGRMLGAGEFASRTGYFLTETRAGTELEIRSQVMAPKRRAAQASRFMAEIDSSARATLKRVRVIAESRTPGLRAWHSAGELSDSS